MTSIAYMTTAEAMTPRAPAAPVRSMQITVRIGHNYGARAVYPVCDTAERLAHLIGKKTFTPSALAQLEALGYTIAVRAPSLTDY